MGRGMGRVHHRIDIGLEWRKIGRILDRPLGLTVWVVSTTGGECWLGRGGEDCILPAIECAGVLAAISRSVPRL